MILEDMALAYEVSLIRWSSEAQLTMSNSSLILRYWKLPGINWYSLPLCSMS